MKRTLLIVGILLLGTALLLAEPTLNGTSGYIIAPSANVEESGPKLAILVSVGTMATIILENHSRFESNMAMSPEIGRSRSSNGSSRNN